MAEAVIGDSEGTARLVAWAPELLAGLAAGITVHITSAKPNNRAEGRNYSIDDKSTVTPAETSVAVPVHPASFRCRPGNLFRQRHGKAGPAAAFLYDAGMVQLPGSGIFSSMTPMMN